MKLCSFVVLLVLAFGYSKPYRFDFEWSEDAGGWLKYHVVPATWDEARLRCHAEGAVLASPLNNDLKAAIVKFVMNKCHFNNEQEFYIFSGVHCTFSKGDYSSIEGVPLLRLAVSWAPGEPDNYENSESCLAMVVAEGSMNGSMIDTQCGRVLPYVCYKKGTDTELTVTECGTTDPEYILEPRIGSCYKFHGRSLVWSEAFMTCAAEGGYLAIINSKQEMNVIKEIYAKNRSHIKLAYRNGMLSVGFHDWGHHDSNFMTIHGETLGDGNLWQTGQPDNNTNVRFGDLGEPCGAVDESARLHDNLCHAPTAFLCEKNPKSLL